MYIGTEIKSQLLASEIHLLPLDPLYQPSHLACQTQPHLPAHLA